MKKSILIIFCMAAAAFCYAADLTLAPRDVRIESSSAGGYHLYIRAKKDIASVLITETTKDPSGKEANYAYRSPSFNPINGNEKRLLDGAFISPDKKIYSLIDSTPERDAEFGSAFHIWIPYIIVYGYEWTRHGETMVLDGTFLNIRTFDKPYADYTGNFADNPFTVNITQKAEQLPVEQFTKDEPELPQPAAALPVTPPEPVKKEPPKPDYGTYMADTVQTFDDIAQNGGGDLSYAKNTDEITPRVRSILKPDAQKTLDLVLVIDATASMKNDIKAIRAQMRTMLAEILSGYRSYRVGLTLYKDYFDEFLTKPNAFTTDLQKFQKQLESFHVMGGRDEPEAVYEGLHTALTAYDWAADERIIILIGDAPPHPRPRGKITREMVFAKAQEQSVHINAIIVPR